MYGCPYGCIYNSETTLRQLQGNPHFSYEPDLIVTAVRESSARVVIEGRRRIGDARFETEVGRVYLAAGAIATTQILLRSVLLYDETVWMKDSQYFLLPIVLTKAVGDATRESLHTLSQLALCALSTHRHHAEKRIARPFGIDK
jgi:hypothetical protein